ncbi:MAG: hypothetical protein ABIZ49_05315, partial [Opitutaceae bacterium]
ATHTTFAYNILQGGGAAAKIEGPYTDAIWKGNLLWGTLDDADLPPAGYASADPLLAVGPDGIKRLQAGSPAMGAAEDFTAVIVDFDGQPRPAKKAVGADELSTEPVVSGLLTVQDVGPLAKLRETPPPP